MPRISREIATVGPVWTSPKAKEFIADGPDEMRRAIRQKKPLRPSTRLTQGHLAASRQPAADSSENDGGGLPRRRYGRVEELIRLLRCFSSIVAIKLSPKRLQKSAIH